MKPSLLFLVLFNFKQLIEMGTIHFKIIYNNYYQKN